MKTIKTGFFAACFLLAGMLGNAQSPTTYSGGQLLGWQELRLDNTVHEIAGAPVSANVAGNALTLSGAAGEAYTQLGWYKNNIGLNSSVGYTIEIKAKVTNANGSFNIQGFDVTGKGFRLAIHPNKLVESTGSLLQNVLNTDANGDQFHVYRIAVSPNGLGYVYRDGALIGNFPISNWAGDNLITDGGFESGASFEELGWIQDTNDTGGTLTISDDPDYKRTGSKGLFVDGSRHTYRPIPLKTGAFYDMNFWAKTIRYQDGEWRDVNGWVDPVSERIIYGIMGSGNVNWTPYGKYEFGGSSPVQVFNMELPVSEDRPYNQTAFDDFLLTEKVTPSRIPANAVNIFPNGDMENPNYAYFPAGDPRNDTTIVSDREDNQAPFWHPFWGARVRVQYSKQDGNEEAGYQYARSGRYSLRYYTCGQEPETYYGDPNWNDSPNDQGDRRGSNSPLNCQVELEVGKTYTFSFWYHTAKWNDNVDLTVENGDEQLWIQNINNSNFPNWKNKIITFTTTAENHTLKLRTIRKGHCVIYFDDLFLFEGEALPEFDNTYLFFGKPAGVEGVDAEIEYVSYDNTGAYDPDGQPLSATYTKKTAPLMTPWGEALQATDPIFNEYPRPLLQRNDWVNLNGIWDFTRKETKAGFGTYNGADIYRQQILVPYPIESALSGIMDTDYANMNKTYAYKRTFTVDPAHAGKQIILHFGAVDWESYVYVNGIEVAHHVGGYDSFSADITSALTGSGEQELVVQIYDPTKGGNPRGKQDPVPGEIWYTPSSGIWQTVWYEAVDPTYIKDLSITPDVDNSAVKIRLDVENAAGATAEVTIMDGTTVLGTQTIAIGQEVSVPVSSPKLWSPDSPFLYGLNISVKKGGNAVDEASSYFGMRKVSLGKVNGMPYMFLNNEPIFHYGTLDQGFWPDGLHTPPTYEALRFDLEETKKLGMNMVRKHIKVEPARWFYYCDSIGLMVWQDMPTPAGLLNERVVGDGSDDAVKANFLRETEALVKNLKNYPSIVMWVPYNEGWGQFAGNDDPSRGDMTHTINGVNVIRNIDNTRLINPASGWTSYEIGEILDRHSYSEPALHDNKYNERASVCGETGGYGFAIDGHIWSRANNPYTNIETAEALANEFKKFNAKAYQLTGQGINGIVYTQFSDVEEEVNGFFTYDRKVNKLELDGGVAGKVLKEGIEWMLQRNVIKPILKTAAQGGEIWKYTTGDEDFTDPGTGWNTQSNYNETGWEEGRSGFGGNGIASNTPWTNQNIFMRKMVAMPALPEADRDGLVFSIFHDEDFELYINGVQAISANGYITEYRNFEISEEAKAAINWGGDNLFAIHVKQTGGGQYVDMGVSSDKVTAPIDEPAPAPIWIEIATAEQFLAIRNNLSGFYKLTADIDIWNVEEYAPIGTTAKPFTGYINGNGHSIKCPAIPFTSGVKENSNNWGLFGYAEGAYFTDLTLTHIEVEGNNDVGTLLGRGRGVTVERVWVKEPKVTGRDHTGGLIGGTFGWHKATRIKDCYVTDGDVFSTEWQAGGLLGVASDTRIENSYFTGNVGLEVITGDNADGAGLVSRFEGGINMMSGVVSLATEVNSGSANEFVSFNPDGVNLNKYVNCLTRDDMIMPELVNPERGGQWTRATEDQKRPIADFMTQALYESIGWNFHSVWMIPDGGGYPVFKCPTCDHNSLPEVGAKANLNVYSSNGMLILEAPQATSVWVYNLSGVLVERLEVENTQYLTLASGVYIVKSVANGNIDAVKVVVGK